MIYHFLKPICLFIGEGSWVAGISVQQQLEWHLGRRDGIGKNHSNDCVDHLSCGEEENERSFLDYLAIVVSVWFLCLHSHRLWGFRNQLYVRNNGSRQIRCESFTLKLVFLFNSFRRTFLLSNFLLSNFLELSRRVYAVELLLVFALKLFVFVSTKKHLKAFLSLCFLTEQCQIGFWSLRNGHRASLLSATK